MTSMAMASRKRDDLLKTWRDQLNHRWSNRHTQIDIPQPGDPADPLSRPDPSLHCCPDVTALGSIPESESLAPSSPTVMPSPTLAPEPPSPTLPVPTVIPSPSSPTEMPVPSNMPSPTSPCPFPLAPLAALSPTSPVEVPVPVEGGVPAPTTRGTQDDDEEMIPYPTSPSEGSTRSQPSSSAETVYHTPRDDEPDQDDPPARQAAPGPEAEDEPINNQEEDFELDYSPDEADRERGQESMVEKVTHPVAAAGPVWSTPGLIPGAPCRLRIIAGRRPPGARGGTPRPGMSTGASRGPGYGARFQGQGRTGRVPAVTT